jgi:tripartite-type tricarboxylate transporter receptor subunit TctC
MKTTILGAALAGLMAMSGSALAQDFPTRPMTMVIPFAAGGPTDLLGRVVAQKMGEILKQNVVVENVGGAGGQTGSKRVAEAKPDGYSFVLGTVGTHAQGQTLYAHPLYNASTDFTPVGLIAEVPIVLITRKDLPASNLKEFVAYAKANEAKMQFGSAGAGSATHLGCVVLNTAMGTPKITHVPYKGTGPAMQDLIAGRIDYLCEIISTAKPQIDGKNVKALAILTKTRSPVEKDVPTSAEQGLDVQAYTWNAIFLPKGTPDAVVKKLNAAMVQAMHDAGVKERLEGFGAQVVTDDRATPDYLGKFVKEEIEKWAAPIKASGVSVN